MLVLWITVMCWIPATVVGFVPARQPQFPLGRTNTRLFQSSYIATCIPGLAEVLGDELRALGCSQVSPQGHAAVQFHCDSTKTALETIVYCRTAHKILELLCESTVSDRDDLAAFCRDSIPVQELLGDGQGGLLTLSVSSILNGRVPKDLNHSHFTALTVKNALCDVVRDLRGDRPNVDVDNPDVPLVLALAGRGEKAHASLYRQLHTGSLHKRGYRSVIHKAAMKETMAAGLLAMAGWAEACRRSSEEPAILVDPMAGSGTLLIEGAMIAADLAPGLMRIKCGVHGARDPPIVRWKNDDDVVGIWRDVLLEASERAKRGLAAIREGGSIEILGNELNEGAARLCFDSLAMAGFEDVVTFEDGDCAEFIPPSRQKDTTPFLVVTNPPWGVRLSDDIADSWEALALFVRHVCPPGSNLWVLSGNKKSTKALRLKRTRAYPLKTGQQDLRWIHYELRSREEMVAMSEARDVAVQEATKASRHEDVRDVPSKVPSNRVARRRPTPALERNEWLID